MDLKEDIINMKHEIKEHSLAWEIIKDNKEVNKRMSIAWASVLITVLILWSLTICYLVYVLNDIGTEEITTEEKIDMDAEGNNNYVGGDNSGTITNN